MPFNHHLNQKVRKQIGDRVIVPIVGPTSVGKTVLMRHVVQLDSDFNRSKGFSTRPRRQDEPIDAYRFLEDTPKQKQQIIDQISTGDLLQFAIYPLTGYIYGTSIDDYLGKYNLIATLSSEVVNFRALGFKACKVIMIIASPKDWQKRFDSRNFTKIESIKRIKEGIDCLEWGLAQDESVHWIENKEGSLSKPAEDIISISKNLSYRLDEPAKETAIKLLHHLDNELIKLDRNM